jgi:hypothetical protein
MVDHFMKGPHVGNFVRFHQILRLLHAASAKQILDTKDLRCPSIQLPGYARAPRSHQAGSQSLDLA